MTDLMESREVKESLRGLTQRAESQGRDADFVTALLDTSTALLEGPQQSSNATLSRDQADFMVRSGMFTPERLSELQQRVADGELTELEQRTSLEAVTNTWSAEEVAHHLGVDTSRVRHRQAKDGLYSFLVGRRRRYPTWQFSTNPLHIVLPGLTSLVRAIPDDMSPASVAGFMTTPQEDLRRDGRELTPVEWLQIGGEPQEVVDILDSFLMS